MLLGDNIDDTFCKFATIGHLYSINQNPAVLAQLIDQLNAENFDTVIFAGDLTTHGTEEQWENVNRFLSKIKSKLLFVPGNHDLKNREARENWLKNVGYLSNKVSIGKCRFILLNSTNSRSVDYEWNKIVSGNGISKSGVEMLEQLNPDNVNLVFMHHTLYSKDLWLADHASPNEYDQNAILQDKKWNTFIAPLLREKAKFVYAGDWHSRIVSITMKDGIVYISNGLAYSHEVSEGLQFSYTTTYVKENDMIINRIVPILFSR